MNENAIPFKELWFRRESCPDRREFEIAVYHTLSKIYNNEGIPMIVINSGLAKRWMREDQSVQCHGVWFWRGIPLSFTMRDAAEAINIKTGERLLIK